MKTVLNVLMLVLGLVMVLTPRTLYRLQDTKSKELQDRFGGGPTAVNLILARIIGAFFTYVTVRNLYELWQLR